MKIVGIDASLTSTGICVLESLPPRTKAIQPRTFGVHRLIEVREAVRKEVQDADLIVLEGYSFGSKGNAVFQTGELGGVLRVMLKDMGLRVLEVAPAQVKKFATGKGNAPKEVMAVQIFKKWGMEFQTNDEGDAFVLAVIGDAFLQRGLYSGFHAYQQEVIAELQGKRKKAG